jgi:predicted permease
MDTAAFANFFLAMAGAGGALIGLLFVAVSIHPERTFGAGARRERQAVATAAFTALVNAFFISSAALIPVPDAGANPGVITLLMGSLGILNTLSIGARLIGYQVRRIRGGAQLWLRLVRAGALVVISLVVYTLEVVNARALVANPRNLDPLYTICGLLLGVYGIGLTRAWELLGAPRFGLSGWLNPLAGEQDDQVEQDTEAT